MKASEKTKYNVGGVLLDRPFKIRRLGHFGFNLVNIDDGIRFYTDLLRYPFTAGSPRGRWRLAGLLFVSQTANALGFFAERRRSQS